MMARLEKIRLGELLVNQKLITQEQLDLALERQRGTGRKLGRVLVEAGFVTEEQIAEALARQLGIPFVDLRHFPIRAEDVQRLPETFARRFRALVLENRKSGVRLAMADPADLFAYDELAKVLPGDIELAVVTESQILAAIDRYYVAPRKSAVSPRRCRERSPRTRSISPRCWARVPLSRTPQWSKCCRALRYAERCGLYVLVQAEDDVVLRNQPGFEPRKW